MRNLLLILCAVFLFSCEKDNSDDLQARLNTFSAKKSGTTWSGLTEVNQDNETDTLTFLGIANHPNSEVVVIKIKFQGTGQYPLTKHQAYYYTTVGGDVIVSQYKLLPNSIGKFTISKFDSDRNQIEGNFELDLKNTYSYSGQDADTLKLINGNFSSIIRD